MQKVITPWREIVHDFGWPLLALLVYSAIAIVMQMQRPNPDWLGEIIMSLIRLAGWLTIIAILVPQNTISIPVRRPWQELGFLCLWGIADAVLLISYWGLVRSGNPSASNLLIASQLGQFVLALVFARVFRYSARALGIPLKHWRLYLAIVLVTPIIIMAFSAIVRAVPGIPFPLWILHTENFNIGVGVFWVFILFILYLCNRERWEGLANDLKSLGPFAPPCPEQRRRIANGLSWCMRWLRCNCLVVAYMNTAM